MKAPRNRARRARSKAGPLVPGAGASPGRVRERSATRGFAARAELTAILADQSNPANARVVAARTLAEMDGTIGKHQAPPSHTSTAPLASLSRDELVSELGRLRALFELGLIT